MILLLNSTIKEKLEFDPSIRIISRILKILLDTNVIGKTALSQVANVNYVTLLKHLEWLENKSVIESIVNEGRIKIRLNLIQRDFALKLCNREN